MDKVKGKLILILVFVLAVNVGIFYKAKYNKTHQDPDHIVVRIADVMADDVPQNECFQEFKKELEEKSNGRFDVRIYPNAVLGGDRQNVESTVLGYLTGCLPGSAVLSGFDPQFMVSDLPFIFKTREAAFKAYDNELGDTLNEKIHELGLVNMGFNQTGYRYITTNNRPIKKPEDLKGLSIRTMENPIHIAAFREWGANPTPMSFSELFTALQQGAVDAQENPALLIMTSRFYEVQDTISLTGHVFSTGVFLVNEDFYKSLSPSDRKLFDEASKNYIKKSREDVEKQEQELLTEAKEKGMNVVELTPEEKDVFVKDAQSVYDLYIKNYGSKQLVEEAEKYNE